MKEFVVRPSTSSPGRRTSSAAIKAAAALACVAVSACGGATKQERAAAVPPPSAAPAPIDPVHLQDVTAGNRAFGLDLYRRLGARPGNLFISPLSIAGAFGPMSAGAQGETRAAITRAMRFTDGGGAAMHPRLGGLLRGLERDRDGATLSIANALWVQDGFAIKPAFARVAREHYDAATEGLDFVGSPGAAAARINAWVAGETRGRIPTLFSPEAFNDRTRLVVTNAVYFLGDWADQFQRYATTLQPFYGPGVVKRVPLMTRRGQYRVLAQPTFQAIDLPYKDERLSMSVFLPNARDGLAAFEASLTPERLEGWLRDLDMAEPYKTVLHLPRVEISEIYDLIPPLTAMGMGVAFTPYKADFRGISQAELYISQVAHKTFVRMDEKGTDAAAATGIVAETVSAPAIFRADHPFFFVLRDRTSGAILFMGRVVDPGAT